MSRASGQSTIQNHIAHSEVLQASEGKQSRISLAISVIELIKSTFLTPQQTISMHSMQVCSESYSTVTLSKLLEFPCEPGPDK